MQYVRNLYDLILSLNSSEELILESFYLAELCELGIIRAHLYIECIGVYDNS
jgi:hypothetical protein